MACSLLLVCVLLPIGLLAEDAVLKEGGATPRYPGYTYESEVPTRTMTVPGSSSGMFFERHEYGDAFLGRWRADYANYGWKDYQNYRLNTTPYLRTYDTFGNFVLDGYEVFSLEELRTRAPESGSRISKGRFYQNWLRHLVIADDAYGGWTNRLMVGDFIHTTFTPLTLDMVNFNGVRFDAISTGGHSLTLLVSRISDPVRLLLTDDLTGQGRAAEVNDGVYLIGGHWESTLRRVLTLGASYVSLYRFDSLRGVRTNTRKGLAPRNAVPQQIIVRFEDDSPEDDRSGAAVFDISARVQLAPPVDAAGEEGTVLELAPESEEFSPGVRVGGRQVEIVGTFRDEAGVDRSAYIDYLFVVPEDAVAVEFSALVGNDYKISMRQKHFFVTNPERGSGEKRETGFAIIRRAEGNIVDLSNKQTISFDYGLATGVEVMGVNGTLAIPGLEVHGEIARSDNHYQYPSLLGQRSGFDDVAGYLTARKDWRRLSLGGEVFRVGPKYTSYNPHPSAPDRPLGEVFYFNEDRQSPYRNPGTLSRDPFYALVDDNDNMLYSETPDNWLVQGEPRELDNPNREGRGIFPFFDLDQDGHADTNRNRNELADYDEPFLMYSSDPAEIYFGDDYNNNGITDAWEDDELPNYPYYKDERGRHLLGSFRAGPGLVLTLGRYDVEQIAASGRNDVWYGRVEFDGRYGRRWQVSLAHESKDVQDDIRNDYFQYIQRDGVLEQGVGAYTRTLHRDRLEARDSFINRGLLTVRFEPASDWRVETKLRYELNHQRRRRFRDGSAQPEDDVDFYGTVFRTDYTRTSGRVEWMPRFKALFQFRGRDRDEDPVVKSLQLVPILRADYRLTPRSQLRFGVQGLPLFPDRRRDFVDEANDSERTTWIAMWFGESEYEGFRIGTEIGVMRQRIDFDEPGREDVEFNRFFVRMISAVGSVVR